MKRYDVRHPVGMLLLAAAFVALSGIAPAQQVPAAPGVPRAPGPPSATGTPPLPAPPVSAFPSPQAAPVPTASTSPTPAPANAVLPPVTSAGSALIRFTGQLLDVRNGYAYFTTSDAFKISPALRIVSLDAGAPVREPTARLYARATLDPASGSIVELALTKRRLPQDAAYVQAYSQAHAFVVAAASRTIPAPEIEYHGSGKPPTGRPVAVTFYVQIPPTTPLSDNVYITTDASAWVANAMRMDRIDALHYRLTRTYASGTKFAYRYTRGSWTSIEVGEDGLEDDPHLFVVPEVDAKRLDNVVYRWSDQNPAQQQVGPDSIPTPFNPNPFGTFPSGIQHPGIPAPSPTPRP